MAVPKRKTSKARRDKRRSNVWKLETPGIVACPNCGDKFSMDLVDEDDEDEEDDD